MPNAGQYTANYTGQSTADTLFTQYGITASDPNLNFVIDHPSSWGSILTAAVYILPILIFGVLIFFMMRQAQGSNNQALSFGKSRARMFAGNRPTVTFADVAGVEEAKQELAEVVEFLKYPDKFAQLGARIPRGVLLVGPPGHRQDPAVARGGRRGRRAVLQHLGFGIRRDVRRRRRQPGPRPVRSGQAKLSLHRLRRRD